jgi:amidophosphoribosyltransferase
MVEATQQPEDRLCTACFTGRYPVPVPSAHLGKHLLEQDELPFDEPRVPADADGVRTGLGVGAADALRRP